jgi:hypothetical protein
MAPSSFTTSRGPIRPTIPSGTARLTTPPGHTLLTTQTPTQSRKLVVALRMFTVTDFNEDMLDSYEDKVREIAEMRDTFMGDAEGFLEDFEKEISFTEVLVWNDSIKEVEMNVREHSLARWTNTVRMATNMHSKLYQHNIQYSGPTENIEKGEVISWTEAKYEAILDGCGDLDGISENTLKGEEEKKRRENEKLQSQEGDHKLLNIYRNSGDEI